MDPFLFSPFGGFNEAQGYSAINDLIGAASQPFSTQPSVAPPPLPAGPPQVPFNFDYSNLPAALADQLGRMGVTPEQFMMDPSTAMKTLQMGSQPAPTLGESLAPQNSQVPLPQANPLHTTVEGSARAPSQGQQSGGSSLTEALKGTKAPAAPQAQRVSTPGAPRAASGVKGGELIALLQALGAQGAGGGLKLPPTLGAALSKFRGF